MQTILLSAFFAGLVAVLVTVAIEKWGGIIGGVLADISGYLGEVFGTLFEVDI